MILKSHQSWWDRCWWVRSEWNGKIIRNRVFAFTTPITPNCIVPSSSSFCNDFHNASSFVCGFRDDIAWDWMVLKTKKNWMCLGVLFFHVLWLNFIYFVIVLQFNALKQNTQRNRCVMQSKSNGTEPRKFWLWYHYHADFLLLHCLFFELICAISANACIQCDCTVNWEPWTAFPLVHCGNTQNTILCWMDRSLNFRLAFKTDTDGQMTEQYNLLRITFVSFSRYYDWPRNILVLNNFLCILVFSFIFGRTKKMYLIWKMIK